MQAGMEWNAQSPPHNTHTHTYMHTHIRTHTHKRMHGHTHTHTHIHAHTHAHTHARTHARTHTRTHTHTHTHTHCTVYMYVLLLPGSILLSTIYVEEQPYTYAYGKLVMNSKEEIGVGKRKTSHQSSLEKLSFKQVDQRHSPHKYILLNKNLLFTQRSKRG